VKIRTTSPLAGEVDAQRRVRGNKNKEYAMDNRRRGKSSTRDSDSGFSFFKSKDEQPTTVEKYHSAMEPIIRRHAERKAGMPGYFQQEMNAHVSEELKRVKTDIMRKIGNLKEEIDDLSDSWLSCFYARKIRIKCVKKYALGEVLSAKTLEGMKIIAARERKNKEVVEGLSSNTAILLDRVIYLNDETQKRATFKK